MRVMFLPLNFGEVIQDGFYDAFQQNNCDLNIFDYMTHYLSTKNFNRIRSSFMEECKKFKPDLLFMQIQHTNVIDASSIVQIKKMFPNIKIVNWTGDVRNQVPNTYLKIGRASDFNLISSTGQLDMFKSALPHVGYLQIGYNPKLYYPELNPRKEFKYDAVFVGNYNAKEQYPGVESRVQTCQSLSKRFDKFALFGHGWPREIKTMGSWGQRDLKTVYWDSVCSISVSHYNDLDHYFSDRLLMCMACGRPCIALRFPKWESYFTNMCDLVIIDSVQDIPDAVQMLKDNPELANYIGQQGAAKVLAEHTYYSRVKELLEMIK